MKKISAWLLTAAMLLALFPISVRAADVLRYTEKNGTLEVASCDRNAAGVVTVPASVNGKPVTSIAESAFVGCRMSAVVLPDSVTEMGMAAFQYCENLISVKFSAGMTTIPSVSFVYCGLLTDLIIPESITRVEGGAFHECPNLSNVYYSGTKSQWEKVSIAPTEETASNYDLLQADVYCETAGPNAPETNGTGKSGCFSYLISNGTVMITGCDRQATDAEIPSSIMGFPVVRIGSGAFGFHEKLERVTIPNTVTKIMRGAFSFCDQLKTVCLPGRLCQIGERAFSNCGMLQSVVLPDTVTRMDSDAFRDCGSLSSVRLSSGLARIPETAFAGCGSLKDLIFPKSITAVESGAFSDCGKLTDVCYSGTEAQWRKVVVQEGNDALKNAAIHFDAAPPFFDELIYRAGVLTADNGPAKQIRQYRYADTPSAALLRSAKGTYLEGSLSAWKTVTLALDTYFDVTSLEKLSVDTEDLYFTAIMDVVRNGWSGESPVARWKADTQDYFDFLSGVAAFMETRYHVDIGDPAQFQALTGERKTTFLIQAQNALQKQIPEMKELDGTFDVMSYLLDGVTTLQDFYQCFVNYMTLVDFSDFMNRVLSQAYEESLKTDNTALQQAFHRCVDVMDQSKVRAALMATEYGCRALGKTACDIGKNIIWDATVRPALGPKVALLMTLYKSEKLLAGLYLNPDGAQQRFSTMMAIADVESVLKATQDTLREQFQSERDVPSAGAFLCALDLAYCAIDMDCRQAYQFVETAENTAWNGLTEIFGGKGFQQELAEIRRQRTDFASVYRAGTTAWMNYLQTGYDPFSGGNDGTFYPTAVDQPAGELVKSITAACLADVYVYNAAGELKASVVGDVLTCSDGNLAVAKYGEEKILHFHSAENYRVEYVGTGQGAMDLEIAEYNSGSEVARIKSFERVSLREGARYEMQIPYEPQRQDAYRLQDKTGGGTVSAVYDSAVESHTARAVNGVIQYRDAAEFEISVPAGATACAVAEERNGLRFDHWECIGGQVEFSDKNAQNTSFVMPKTNVTVRAVFLKQDGTEPTRSIRNPFRDVKQGAYYYDPVLWAVNRTPQITNGTSATTFEPDKTCTRGQVVTFLWRAKGCPEPTSRTNPFADVKEGAYYYKAVLWAVENKITNGTSATAFSPESPCTRAHVVTFLHRAEGNPPAGKDNPFRDVAAGQYYTDAVLWAVSREITNGTDATHFSPDKPCTRGQIVTFLYRDMK